MENTDEALWELARRGHRRRTTSGVTEIYFDSEAELEAVLRACAEAGAKEVETELGRVEARAALSSREPGGELREAAHKWIDEHIPLQFAESATTELDREQLEQLLEAFAASRRGTDLPSRLQSRLNSFSHNASYRAGWRDAVKELATILSEPPAERSEP